MHFLVINLQFILKSNKSIFAFNRKPPIFVLIYMQSIKDKCFSKLFIYLNPHSYFNMLHIKFGYKNV